MRFRFPTSHTAFPIGAVLVALGWSAFLAILHLDGRATVLDRIEGPLVDLRFALTGPRPAPESVTIIAIDDETLAAGHPYPLPRSTIAHLVHELQRHEVKLIALDILFLDPGDPAGDTALAQAVKKVQAVVAAAAVFDPAQQAGYSESGLSTLPHAARVLWPMDQLRLVAGVGIVNISTDYAGTPRHVPLLVRSGETLLPSFALRTASRAAGSDPELFPDRVKIGTAVTHTDVEASLPLRFYGPRGTISTISASRVLQGEVSSEEIRGRIAIIGATALGSGDTFATPFDPVMPGAEVLATATSHLMAGDGLVRDRDVRRIDAAATVMLPITMILLTTLRRIAFGFLLMALVAGLWAAFVTLAFTRGYWFSASVPLAATILPVLLHVAGRLWIDRRTEQRLAASQNALRRFHPTVLADRISSSPNFLDRPVQQHAAVLFIDLSGFTGLSEQLGPERTRDLLKGLHTLIEDVVTEHGGLVLTYMGDGAMIIFGLPEIQGDDACRAVSTALALVKATHNWLGSLPAEMHAARLGVKVGAHYGPVVISRLGTEAHQHITATGDSVNVASRLMAVAAQHGALVAISDDLWRAASVAGPIWPDALVSAPVEVGIRGRTHPVTVRFWHPDRRNF